MSAGFTGHLDNGYLIYNGIVFDKASSITVTQEPVPDDAGMGVRFNEITIRVRASITGGPGVSLANTADTPVEVARRLLLKSGGHLFFAQKGFGFPLEVNAGAGSMTDVNFGPKTQLFSWTPVGGNKTVEIEWAVKVAVPFCYVTRVQTVGIMAFNFGMAFSIDQDGMTTRTISGYYEIAMTTFSARGSYARKNRALPDSADYYWDTSFARFKAPRGFKRTHSRTLSPNKKRMDFSITDVEIPSNNPFPEGVTNIRASHHVGWSRSNMCTFRNDISASITLPTGTQPFWAWAIFVNLARQRLNRAIEKTTNNWVIIDSLSAQEDMFGLTHNFRISYRFLSSIENMIESSGLFQPVGTNWDKWEYRLAKQRHARGTARLGHDKSMETIYDLCGGTLPNVNDRGARPNIWKLPPGRNVFGNQTPPRDKSWKKYNVVVIPQRDRNVTRQQILQPPTAPVPQPDGPPQYEQNQAAADDVIRETGNPQYSFRYIGHAERVGWEIPRPQLMAIGGQPTHEVSNQFMSRCIGDYLGVPVYSAAWNIEYLLPNAPTQVDVINTNQRPWLASDMA